jgi:hypothetical protein
VNQNLFMVHQIASSDFGVSFELRTERPWWAIYLSNLGLAIRKWLKGVKKLRVLYPSDCCQGNKTPSTEMTRMHEHLGLWPLKPSKSIKAFGWCSRILYGDCYRLAAWVVLVLG